MCWVEPAAPQGPVPTELHRAALTRAARKAPPPSSVPQTHTATRWRTLDTTYKVEPQGLIVITGGHWMVRNVMGGLLGHRKMIKTFNMLI